jgi:tRNA (mo5U34)-methyltransferase
MVLSPEQAAEWAYAGLPDCWPGNTWLGRTAELAREKLSGHRHGDLLRWLAAVESLPSGQPAFSSEAGLPRLGTPAGDLDSLRTRLMELHPWRKGPLSLGGLEIDTEWRSDWKWERVAPHLEMKGGRVLDIGCGNGYFGYRMLAAGADLVVGVDPTLLFVMQWLACRHFAGNLPNYVLPLGIEELPEGPAGFDLVFSMGVLYHRKEPLEHLARIRELLRPGGTMVLETLVLPPGQEEDLLVPPGRYAAMRNVWGVPGTGRLASWAGEAGFSDTRLVDLSVTTIQEQRSTDWMRFESLEQALDDEDPGLTREGHPAPTRAVLLGLA